MQAKTYFRPFGIVAGPDARRLIAAGQAGALGGMATLAFTQIEVIERRNGSITKRDISYADGRHEAVVTQIERPRPSFGGCDLGSTRIMGIVNVTPDSFSDGGRHASTAAAIAHGRDLAKEGASILDVGGESTRPGSDEVSLEEESNRVLPVISALSSEVCVSVDTRKPDVMRGAVAAGAAIINDVSALGFAPESMSCAAALARPVVLMHAQGSPKTMQLNPRYENVLLDVYDWLAERLEAAELAGLSKDLLAIDPGIGFGKTFPQNLELMNGLSLFHGLGVGLLVGLSRKGFIGSLTGERVAENRVNGSVGGALHAAWQGAHIIRVHDVKPTVDALAVFTASHDPDSVEF